MGNARSTLRHLLSYLRTYLLTYLITSFLSALSRVLLEKLTGFQLVKKLPQLYGTRRFITASTSARHLSLSWASSIQSIPPHPTSWRSILRTKSHFPSPLLSSYQSISPGRRLAIWIFRNMILFLRWGVFSSFLNPQAGIQPLVGCPRLFIQYIRSYPPYWRPFLHQQPEDAPCRGEREPLIMHVKTLWGQNVFWHLLVLENRRLVLETLSSERLIRSVMDIWLVVR